jgi:general secretion pathway protein J
VARLKRSHKRIKEIEPIQSIRQRKYSQALGTSGTFTCRAYGGYDFRHFQSGFTLFELLVAIVIFALVLSTIYASATGTFRVVEDIEAQVELYRMARIAMERIIEDLESVYIQEAASKGKPSADTLAASAFVGEDNEIDGRSADGLRFTSRAHVNLSGEERDPGAAEIVYYVREGDEGEGLIFYRNDRPLFEVSGSDEEDTGGLVLCERLHSVDFTYHEQDGTVREDWDTDSDELKGALPTMVSISLEFNYGSGSGVPLKFFTRVSIPAGQGAAW